MGVISPSYSREALQGFGNTTLRSLVRPRCQSLLRANVLVLGSLLAAFWVSDFPQNRPTLWLIVPLVIAAAGSADAVRCMRRHWNLYHGAVVLSLYMHLMAISLILFFLLWPFTRWFE